MENIIIGGKRPVKVPNTILILMASQKLEMEGKHGISLNLLLKGLNGLSIILYNTKDDKEIVQAIEYCGGKLIQFQTPIETIYCLSITDYTEMTVEDSKRLNSELLSERR